MCFLTIILWLTLFKDDIEGYAEEQYGWLVLVKHHIQWTKVLTGTLTLFQAVR